MSDTNSLINTIASGRRSWMIHLFIWPLAFVVLLFVFTKGQLPIKVDYYYTLVFLLFCSIPVIINFYVLITSFLNREKYILYVFGLLLIFLGIGSVMEYYFLNIIDFLFPNYFFISYLGENDFYLVLAIVLITTTFIKITGDWLYFNRHQNELLKLQKQHIQTQLTALRAQINPHFLFNALNVIYAMSLDQKGKMTQAIVELSDILRYVIYDADTDRVRLKDEIQLLKNYIAFQKHRIKDTPVNFQISIENEDFKIYPMLLLPLLENAYKYGSSSEKEIKISLSENEEHFKFSILNPKVNTGIIQDGSYSGIGLSSLKENLELVYKNNYSIDIVDLDDSFKVELILNKS